MVAEQSPSPEPVFRTMRPDEVDEVFSLIQNSFGEAWPGFPLQVPPLEHLQWKMSSPNLLSDDTTVVELDGRLVGYWGSVERDVWVQGRNLPGRIGVDRLLHPDVQGRGLSTAYREWLRTERPIVKAVHFGEGSTHPRLRRAAKHNADEKVPLANPVDVLLLPLDVAAMTRGSAGQSGLRQLLRRIRLSVKMFSNRRKWPPFTDSFGAIDVRTVEKLDARADTLWKQVRDTLDFAVVRDRRYLNWRFCDPRAGAYRVRAVEGEGELLGYMVTCRRDGEVLIIDLLTVPGRQDALRSLTEDAIGNARAEGAAALSVLMPRRHPHRDTLHRYGFIVSRPRNLGLNTWNDVPLEFLGTDPNARVHVAFGDDDTV